MKKILNQEGMSLVQVVIAAGVMSMLGVVMMKMQENQIKTQNDISAKAEIVSFMQKMNSLMSSPGYCEKNLNGLNVSGKEKINLDEFVAPNGKIIYKVGDIYGDRQLILRGMEQKDFFFDDEEKTRGVLSFLISLEKKKKSFGAKTVIKSMDVIVSVDEIGVIQGCSSISMSGLSGGVGKIDIGSVQKVIEQEAKRDTDIRKVNDKKGLDEKQKSMNLNEVQIKKIIDNNPALKEMQEAIKNMYESNKAMEKMYEGN